MAEHLDVLVVGAGLSGIGAAVRVRQACPDQSLAVLEARGAIGGTWDLFRYPGVRSDSDMFTLGYPFRPWTAEQAIADGPDILAYLRDTARAEGVEPLVRLRTRVTDASWSSTDQRWTVTAVRTEPTGAEERVILTCGFLLICSGYYRYDRGHRPTFPGEEEFAGRLVHPQFWPADLDLADRRVVVIGSGATAVSLVPALARSAASVTMLQRSPSYVGAVPGRDRAADLLRRRLPPRVASPLVRTKSIATQLTTYQLSRRRPDLVRRTLRAKALTQLPAGYAVDVHFGPTYRPWDQRLCAARDGDLFRTIRDGRAEVVTDRIARFTPTGILCGTGRHLAADVVVTATGLELLVIGGIRLVVDGEPYETAGALTYKGLMFAGVPNLAFTVGYTNASWALRSDLVARYVGRLLRHLGRTGAGSVTPVAPRPEQVGTRRPIIDLPSGYVQRSAHRLPTQGTRSPWLMHQNYLRDLALLRYGPVTDAVRFAPARVEPGAR